MFFILSKILGFIIYPIHFILILTITYLLLIKIKILKTFSRFILILLSICLVFGGSDYFSSYFLWKLEQTVPVQLPDNVAGIILLGGSFRPMQTALKLNQVSLTESAERATETLYLLNENPNSKLIFVASSGSLNPSGPSEAKLARSFFKKFKINENRMNIEPLAKNTSVPEKYAYVIDDETQGVINLVNDEFSDHFGSTDDFIFAVTRNEALECLHRFIEERLICFGDYQDAMIAEDPWLFHSHLSMYLNNGLLKPKECIDLAEKAFYESKVPINSVEGFIRQILGWREYVRGLYWLKMPNYRILNELAAEVSLPSFYWDAETKMNCLKTSIENTRDNAYSHHIQRLMVLGNFALIAGIKPKEVNEWFLSVYADAYEWVELPNVSGMALFADGGIMASKPYASSGAYINRMSNYCKDCHYDVKEKIGKKACPFNYLYWNFLDRNREKLSSNPRLGLAYRNLNNMSEDQLSAVNESAQIFFSVLNHEKI